MHPTIQGAQPGSHPQFAQRLFQEIRSLFPLSPLLFLGKRLVLL